MLSIYITQSLEATTQGAKKTDEKTGEEAGVRTDVIYFFCSAEDERRNNSAAVIRGLLWQITGKRPDLTKHLLEYLETPERTQSSLSSLGTLWSMFVKLVHDPAFGSVFCVVDGLDECNEDSRRLIITKLMDFASPESANVSKTTLKLALVSRDIPGLKSCVRI